MSIKHKLVIILVGAFIGLYIGNLQGEMKNPFNQYMACSQEQILDDTYAEYEFYNISDGDININKSGKYYIYGTATTPSIYTIQVESAARKVEVVLDNVNIDVSNSEAKVAFANNNVGETEVVLIGNNTLKSGFRSAGILINSLNRFSISDRSTGRLEVRGGGGAAGIGGSEFINGGKVYINGGEIYAYGGAGCCAIGAGKGGKGGTKKEKPMKKIEINGGYVYCEGGYKSSALGGGDNSYTKEVVINNGVVEARANYEVSAIGRGRQEISNTCKIDILGGTVIAYQGMRKKGSGNIVEAINISNNGSIGEKAIIIATNFIKGKGAMEDVEVLDVGDIPQPFSVSILALDVFVQNVELLDHERNIYLHLPKGKYGVKLEGDNKVQEYVVGKELNIDYNTDTPIDVPTTIPTIMPPENESRLPVESKSPESTMKPDGNDKKDSQEEIDKKGTQDETDKNNTSEKEEEPINKVAINKEDTVEHKPDWKTMYELRTTYNPYISYGIKLK